MDLSIIGFGTVFVLRDEICAFTSSASLVVDVLALSAVDFFSPEDLSFGGDCDRNEFVSSYCFLPG